MSKLVQKKLLTLCLLCENSHVLLGMKKRGFGEGRWNGFGGKVEIDETIEEGAHREFLEEAGITVGPLNAQGILEFEFEGNPEILEVHVFKATQYTGQPVETEEMKPQWFEISKIPFDKMWPDDVFWFPIFFEGKKFTGKFYFNANEELISHDIKTL